MNMTKRNNLSTIIFICLVAIGSGGIIAGGVFYLDKNNELVAKINQRQSEFRQMKEKVAILPVLKEQSKTGIAEINRLHRFVPGGEEQAAFVLELERIARNCGVDIIICKMEDKTKLYKNLTSYQVYQWAVELDGEYYGVRKFLEMVPESKRFMMVSSINLKASEPESESRRAYVLNTQLILDLIAPMEQGRVNL